MAGRGPRPPSSVVIPYAAPVESESDSDESPRPQPQPQPRKGREWINDEEWIITEASKVTDLRSPLEVSIFRVPDFLKQSREGAYVPRIVSLGQYNHSNNEQQRQQQSQQQPHPQQQQQSQQPQPPQQQLSPMQKHKERALSRMRARFNATRRQDITTEGFSSHAQAGILSLDREIRKIYETKIDCDAGTLAQMLCLDGCFVLEILRTLGKEKLPVPEEGNYYEPIFERNKIDYTGFHILCDILMLENQIPLIVLRKLLELELNSPDDVATKAFDVLVKSSRFKFYPFKYDMGNWSLSFTQQPQQPQPQAQQQQPLQPQQQLLFKVSPKVHDHLLGLLHGLIVSPPFPHDQNKSCCLNIARYICCACSTNKPVNAVRRIPCAVELTNAGIKFERNLGGIEKIKFEGATIYLPPIQITDFTEVLFRNLIALELCKPSLTNFVTCYVSLMDELINSEEDVAVLRKSEIITNYLGSDTKVAELFNDLLDGVSMSRKAAFRELKGLVYAHYKSKFQVRWAEFVKEHFSSPWRQIALAGAILALVFSFLQTFFTIYGIYK